MRVRDEFVLDASAILAWAQVERGYRKVKEILQDARKGRVACSVCWVNLGEVYYLSLRRLGKRAADDFLTNFRRLSVDLVVPSEDLVLAAAVLKASHERLSFADCFAAALALAKSATLLATDPDFESLRDRLSLALL